MASVFDATSNGPGLRCVGRLAPDGSSSDMLKSLLEARSSLAFLQLKFKTLDIPGQLGPKRLETPNPGSAKAKSLRVHPMVTPKH